MPMGGQGEAKPAEMRHEFERRLIEHYNTVDAEKFEGKPVV
jgi:hypothetical protein